MFSFQNPPAFPIPMAKGGKAGGRGRGSGIFDLGGALLFDVVWWEEWTRPPVNDFQVFLVDFLELDQTLISYCALQGRNLIGPPKSTVEHGKPSRWSVWFHC